MQQMQQFTDKDFAGDVLTGVKHMAECYMTAVLESQDQNLRQTFMDFHDQCLNDHYRIFQIMKQNGWYKVPMILDESQPQSF
ncbi:MAG: spore coat protein [Bacillota bacterium]|nr:spore coat protein [Bacillota bacterium]